MKKEKQKNIRLRKSVFNKDMMKKTDLKPRRLNFHKHLNKRLKETVPSNLEKIQ